MTTLTTQPQPAAWPPHICVNLSDISEAQSFGSDSWPNLFTSILRNPYDRHTSLFLMWPSSQLDHIELPSDWGNRSGGAGIYRPGSVHFNKDTGSPWRSVISCWSCICRYLNLTDTCVLRYLITGTLHLCYAIRYVKHKCALVAWLPSHATSVNRRINTCIFSINIKQPKHNIGRYCVTSSQLIAITIDSGIIVYVITVFTRELRTLTAINYGLITDMERLMNLISGILFIRIHLAYRGRRI